MDETIRRELLDLRMRVKILEGVCGALLEQHMQGIDDAHFPWSSMYVLVDEDEGCVCVRRTEQQGRTLAG